MRPCGGRLTDGILAATSSQKGAQTAQQGSAADSMVTQAAQGLQASAPARAPVCVRGRGKGMGVVGERLVREHTVCVRDAFVARHAAATPNAPPPLSAAAARGEPRHVEPERPGAALHA